MKRQLITQLIQKNNKTVEAKHEIKRLETKEILLVEAIDKGSLPPNILDMIVGGLDDNPTSDSTKLLDGSGQLESIDADDMSTDGSEAETTEVLEPDSFSAQSNDGDLTQDIVNSESIDATPEEDGPLVFGDPNSDNVITLSDISLSWGDSNEIQLHSGYTSETNDDGAFVILDGPTTIQITNTIDVFDDNQHIHIDPNGESYRETMDQQNNPIHTSLDSILEHPNARFTTTPDGLLSIEIPPGDTTGDFTNTVNIELNANPDALIVERGLNTLFVPSDASISSGSFNTLTFASDDQTLNILGNQDNYIQLTFNATGATFLSFPGDHMQYDGVFFSPDAQFTGSEDGSLIIRDGDKASVIDAQGNLAGFFFGMSGNSTFLTNLSDQTLALVPNSGSDLQLAVVIDDRFTPQADEVVTFLNPLREVVEKHLLTFVSPANNMGEHEVIHVDENGNIQHAWGVTDVDAWVNALSTGEAVDDLVRTQINITPTGQASLQSKDLDEPIQFGIATLTTQGNDISVLDINNEQGDFQRLIHADGSVEVENTFINQVFGDPSDNSAITVTYGLSGKATWSWGNNRLNFPESFSETEVDGSLIESNGSITYQLTTAGEINITFDAGQQRIHIAPNGESYKESVDQDEKIRHISLDPLLADPNAILTLSSTGSLKIEITDGNANNAITVTLNASPDSLLVENGFNTFSVPSDAITSYSKADNSILFASDIQTLRISDDGFDITYNATGLSLMNTSVEGIGEAVRWEINGESHQAFDARVVSFVDGSAWIVLRNGVTMVADSEGHLSDLIFGEEGTTWLMNLSDDKSTLNKTLALVPKNGKGTDQAIVIDEGFTPFIDDAGNLTFISTVDENGLQDLIRVDQSTGNIVRAWGVSDVDAWIEGSEDAHTQLTVTQAGQASIESQDLEGIIQLGDAVIFNGSFGLTAIDIANNTGDHQLLVYSDGSVDVHNTLNNRVFDNTLFPATSLDDDSNSNVDNPVTLSFDVDGQATISGENIQFSFPQTFKSHTEDDNSVTLSDGAMIFQFAPAGISDVTIGKNHVHIDQNGDSYTELLDQNGKIIFTTLNPDADFTLTQDGELSIKSTDINGETTEILLQSALTDSGELITTHYETTTAHGVTLTTGIITKEGPESDRITPYGQVTFTDTPAEFNLVGNKWSDGQGVDIPGNAVAQITEDGKVVFNYQNSDGKPVAYQFKQNGDLESIVWPDEANSLALVNVGGGTFLYAGYTASGEHITLPLSLPIIDPTPILVGDQDAINLALSNQQFISSDGTIFLVQDMGEDGIQPVAIDTTGQIINVDEAPSNNPYADWPLITQQQLINENVVRPLAAAILTYGQDNLPYWAEEHSRFEDEYPPYEFNRQASILIAQQLAQQALESEGGLENLKSMDAELIKNLPFHYADEFSVLIDKNQDNRAQIWDLALQIATQQQFPQTVLEKISDQKDAMQKTHDDLLNQITPKQLDELTDSFINGAKQPEWADALLSNLDTVQLDQLLDKMQSRLPNDDNLFKLDSDLNKFRTAQADMINDLAEQIVDMGQDNFLDWADQALANPQSAYAQLDAVQQLQLTNAVQDLAQAKHDEVLESVREYYTDGGDGFTTNADQYIEGLDTQQKLEFEQYIKDIAKLSPDLLSDWLSGDPDAISKVEEIHQLIQSIPDQIDSTQDVPPPPKHGFFDEMVEAFGIVGSHILIPGLSEIPGVVGDFFKSIGEGLASGIAGLGGGLALSVASPFDTSLFNDAIEGFKLADEGFLGGEVEDAIKAVKGDVDAIKALLQGNLNQATNIFLNSNQAIAIDVALDIVFEGVGATLKLGAKALKPIYETLKEETSGFGSAFLPSKEVQEAATAKSALNSTTTDDIVKEPLAKMSWLDDVDGFHIRVFDKVEVPPAEQLSFGAGNLTEEFKAEIPSADNLDILVLNGELTGLELNKALKENKLDRNFIAGLVAVMEEDLAGRAPVRYHTDPATKLKALNAIEDSGVFASDPQMVNSLQDLTSRMNNALVLDNIKLGKISSEDLEAAVEDGRISQENLEDLIGHPDTSYQSLKLIEESGAYRGDLIELDQKIQQKLLKQGPELLSQGELTSNEIKSLVDKGEVTITAIENIVTNSEFNYKTAKLAEEALELLNEEKEIELQTGSLEDLKDRVLDKLRLEAVDLITKGELESSEINTAVENNLISQKKIDGIVSELNNSGLDAETRLKALNAIQDSDVYHGEELDRLGDIIEKIETANAKELIGKGLVSVSDLTHWLDQEIITSDQLIRISNDPSTSIQALRTIADSGVLDDKAFAQINTKILERLGILQEASDMLAEIGQQNPVLIFQTAQRIDTYNFLQDDLKTIVKSDLITNSMQIYQISRAKVFNTQESRDELEKLAKDTLLEKELPSQPELGEFPKYDRNIKVFVDNKILTREDLTSLIDDPKTKASVLRYIQDSEVFSNEPEISQKLSQEITYRNKLVNPESYQQGLLSSGDIKHAVENDFFTIDKLDEIIQDPKTPSSAFQPIIDSGLLDEDIVSGDLADRIGEENARFENFRTQADEINKVKETLEDPNLLPQEIAQTQAKIRGMEDNLRSDMLNDLRANSISDINPDNFGAKGPIDPDVRQFFGLDPNGVSTDFLNGKLSVESSKLAYEGNLISDEDVLVRISDINDIQQRGEVLNDFIRNGMISDENYINLQADIHRAFLDSGLSVESSKLAYERGAINDADVFERISDILDTSPSDDRPQILDNFDQIITTSNYIKLLNAKDITIFDIPKTRQAKVFAGLAAISIASGLAVDAVLIGIDQIPGSDDAEPETENELTPEDQENIETVNSFIDDHQDGIQQEFDDLQAMNAEELDDFKASLDPMLLQADLDFDSFMSLSVENQIDYIVLTMLEVDNQLEMVDDSSAFEGLDSDSILAQEDSTLTLNTQI